MGRRRDPEWYPALGMARADVALEETVRDLLRLHDLGAHIPPAMFELLRERLSRAESYRQKSPASAPTRHTGRG